MSEVLMVMPSLFKTRTGIHDNIDEKLLTPEIRTAQVMYIRPLLGTALYNKIITDIGNETLSGNYKTLHDTYIVDALCNYVLSELPLALNFQFFNKGVQTQTTEQTNQPSMQDLFTLGSKYKKRAEALADLAIKYLRANASQMFPEYLQAGSTSDTIYPEGKAYASSLYYGGGYEMPSPNKNPNLNSNDPYYD